MRPKPKVGDIVKPGWTGDRKVVYDGVMMMLFERMEKGWMRVA